MEIQQITPYQIEVFRKSSRNTLDNIFGEAKIVNPSAYFAIWQELKRALEEEFRNLVNNNCQIEIKKICGE